MDVQQYKLQQLLSVLDQQNIRPMQKVIVLLGPTASGKTALAVALAQHLKGEIISADSRQVYRQMDIGTGKDLETYGSIPYHLIDIKNPGEKYHLGEFLTDYQHAKNLIESHHKQVIVCGGTGLYLQHLILPSKYNQIPSIPGFKEELSLLSKEDLLKQLDTFELPNDLTIDRSTKKRILRGIEILTWLQQHPNEPLSVADNPEIIVFGLETDVETRRQNIAKRLHNRLENGLIEEVEGLLKNGVSHADLHYYGLEYKYVSLYLTGEMDKPSFVKKLETEIHRYAKRQMTYFRKMEKDGIHIHWI